MLEQASIMVYSQVRAHFTLLLPWVFLGAELSNGDNVDLSFLYSSMTISVLHSGAINPHLEPLALCESNFVYVCVCVRIVVEINVLGKGQC